MIQAISFQEGKHILDTYPGSVLLDVRTEDEYALEHAAGQSCCRWMTLRTRTCRRFCRTSRQEF